MVLVIVGVLYMINSTAFEAIVSVNTIGAQASYLIPIFLRITVSRKTFKPGTLLPSDDDNGHVAYYDYITGPWSLGRFSTICGVLSCCWLLVGINLMYLVPILTPLL